MSFRALVPERGRLLWALRTTLCMLIVSTVLPIVAPTMLLTVNAQDAHKVTGTVTDFESKQALVGAVVKVKGTKVGVIVRRSDGAFSIDVPKSSSQVLVISLVGKKTQEVNVAGKDNISVMLKNDVLELDKVVVTAVGIEQEKRSLGYSTQEVSGTKLTGGGDPNIVNALVGKVAGIQINSSSGSPGSSSNIRLRGISSLIGSNQPVFVIDGVLIDNTDYGATYNSATNDPTTSLGNFVDGVDQPNRILDINPDDIESINVLKGAAATALYGLNASAGAIVITTKKGHRDGNVNIQYSYTRQMDEVNKLPELQNKYGQGISGGWLAPNASPSAKRYSWGPAIDTLFWDGSSFPWDKHGKIVGKSSAPQGAVAVTPYDNTGKFFQVGESNTHNLTISAGNPNGSYLFSMSDMTSSGIIPNSSFDRRTMRLNADYGIYTDAKVSASVQYTSSGGTRTQRGSNVSGVMLGLVRTPITFDNSNGTSSPTDQTAYLFSDGRQRTFRGFGGYDNPYFTVNNNLYTDNVERWIGSAQADYFPASWFGKEILGDFNATLRFGGDFYSIRDRQVYAVNSAVSPGGHVADGDIRNRNLNIDLIGTFTRQISDDIKGTLTVGGQLYSAFTRSFISNADGLTIPGFYNQSNASSHTVTETEGNLRRGAFISSLNLGYKTWLYLQGNLRIEQSTTLPVDNNQFMYGNVAAGLVFTDLLGMKDDGALQYGKIRLSYATVGSDAPIYSLTTPYTSVVITDGWIQNAFTYPFNSVSGFSRGASIGNNSLHPETRNELEGGLELKFFDNRLGLDLTYYSTKNIDQILPVRVSLASGYQFRLTNAATMENNGIEVTLSGTPYKDKDFSIDAIVNFSTFSNTVTELAPGIDNLFIAGFTSGQILAVKGMTYGQIYGQDWLRDKAGNIIVGDDGLPSVDPISKFLGANIPDFIMGGTLSATYKGLTFSAVVDWKQGGKMWNGTRSALNTFGTAKATENRGTMNGTYDGITIQNGVVKGVYIDSTGKSSTNTIVVAGGLGQNFWGPNGSDNSLSGLVAPFVEDAGWFRLKEVRLSYRLPKEWTDALSIFQGLDVFVSGRNLFLSTKYTGVDPETSLVGGSNGQGLDYFNNPGTRTYGFGIHASF